MVVTEVSNESWFSRIGGAFKGILIGGLLFLISFPLLFWNEGRAVRRAKTLKEGRGAVVENVPNDNVDAMNEGALVHMSGTASSTETLADSLFGIAGENAIKLRRTVEMYQWEEDVHTESKKKLGGGRKTVKTYSYDKVWSEDAIDSDDFHPDGKNEYGNGNPPMPFQSDVVEASVVNFGSFELNEGQVAQISSGEAVAVSEEDLAAMTDRELADQLKLHSDGFYKGEDPAIPKIGDLRVSFEVVGEQPVSLIAQQQGNSFTAFKLPKGTIDLFSIGEKSADDMFTEAERMNIMILWLVRLGGFLLMTVGLAMIFRPLVVFADVVPLFGNLLGAGIAIVSALISGILSICVIAIAWLFYRPLLAIGLFAVAIALILIVRKLFKKQAASNVMAGKDGIPVVE